jgi:threonine/homoserine/homoserine lactone efflux protein
MPAPACCSRPPSSASAIFATTPWLLTLLQWAGAAYVMYLALGLLRAQWHVTTATAPIGFARAALLQFLYPKLCLMAIATVALCTQDDGAVSFLLTAFFLAMTLPGMLPYLSMGRVLRALAESPRGRVGVNRSLAAMTALSALLPVMPA